MKASEYPYRITLYKSDICVIKDAPSDVFGVYAFLVHMTGLTAEERLRCVEGLRNFDRFTYNSPPNHPLNYKIVVKVPRKKRWFRKWFYGR